MAVKTIRRSSRPTRRGLAVMWGVLAFMYAGCFPSSCHRIEPRDISPSDSLSRRIAESLTPDTIQSVIAYSGAGDQTLEWPRTVLLDHEGRVYVGDTKRHSIFVFDTDGTAFSEFTWPGAMFPYLAGWRTDTLVVFTPGESQGTMNYVVDMVRVRAFNTPEVPVGTLQYATTDDSSVFVKAVTQADTHFVWQMNHQGFIEAEAPLYGTSWDHAGFLRTRGPTVFSLTGFFPRIAVWPDSLSSTPLNMRLRGFDSPMLRRSWGFLQGSSRNAPLLTSSAALEGGFWFVLNLRPGWLRVDVYDPHGDLKNILIEEAPGYAKQFYPLDLAVQQTADGVYDIVVAVASDRPIVRRYVWNAEDT